MRLTVTTIVARARAARLAGLAAGDPEADIAAALRDDRTELSLTVDQLASYMGKQGPHGPAVALVLRELAKAIAEAP